MFRILCRQVLPQTDYPSRCSNPDLRCCPLCWLKQLWHVPGRPSNQRSGYWRTSNCNPYVPSRSFYTRVARFHGLDAWCHVCHGIHAKRMDRFRHVLHHIERFALFPTMAIPNRFSDRASTHAPHRLTMVAIQPTLADDAKSRRGIS